MNSSTIQCKNIGNADEQEIEGIFSYFGAISSTKVIKRNNGDNQAIVTFNDPSAAITARNNTQELRTHEGLVISVALSGENASNNNSNKFTGNFNKQPAYNQAEAEDACHIYVGDFGPEIDNNKLKEHFMQFGKILHAKVILDTQTQTSKGYGFVTFANKDDAENAINKMNGQWIGYSTIKVNWATRKPTNASKPLSYDQMYRQTSPTNRTVYIGNLDIHVPDDAIRDLCMQHGKIVDLKLHMHRGYGFVKYASKDEACRAICQMHGKNICNVILKCSWGKEDQLGGGVSDKIGIQQSPFALSNQVDTASPYGALNGQLQSQAHPNYGASVQSDTNQMSASNLAAYQQMYMMQYYQQLASNPALAQQYQQALLQQQQQQHPSQQIQSNGTPAQTQQVATPNMTPQQQSNHIPSYWNQN